MFFGYFLAGIIYHVKHSLALKKEHGYFWSKEHSIYFKKDQSTGSFSFNYFNASGIALRSVFATLVQFATYFILYLSILAGINYSLIYPVLGLAPFAIALSFHFLFKEYLQLNHYIGMVLILLFILIIGLSSQSSTASSGVDDSEYISILYPMGAGLVYVVLAAFTNIVLRYWIIKGRINSM